MGTSASRLPDRLLPLVFRVPHRPGTFLDIARSAQHLQVVHLPPTTFRQRLNMVQREHSRLVAYKPAACAQIPVPPSDLPTQVADLLRRMPVPSAHTYRSSRICITRTPAS